MQLMMNLLLRNPEGKNGGLVSQAACAQQDSSPSSPFAFERERADAALQAASLGKRARSTAPRTEAVGMQLAAAAQAFVMEVLGLRVWSGPFRCGTSA